MSAATLAMVPEVRRGFRLQWEPVQQAHVLLYPEGMVKLNESAAHILQLVDGQRTVAVIIATLSERFPEATDLEADILNFIEAAHDKHWIRTH